MKVTIYYITSDTELGNDLEVFQTNEQCEARMRQMILNALGDPADDDSENVKHIRALLSGSEDDDLYEAWSLWTERKSYSNDYYSHSDIEIEVPMPELDALIEALQLARRAFTGDPNDIEYLDARIISKKDILKKIDTALAEAAAQTSLIVTVEVSGGVAEATDVPAGVEVNIVDRDNEKVG
jgi:hypothetical protein